MSEETTEEAGICTKKAVRLSYQHVGAIEASWKPGVVFTQQGLARAQAIYAWITGLLHGGMKPADVETIARDFNNQLLCLAQYGGMTDFNYTYNDQPRSTKVPSYIVEAGDDATFNGFSLLWYRLLDTEEKVSEYLATGRSPKSFFYHPEVSYGFSFNGGLIYHGPGAGATHAVTLTSHLWSVHT